MSLASRAIKQRTTIWKTSKKILFSNFTYNALLTCKDLDRKWNKKNVGFNLRLFELCGFTLYKIPLVLFIYVELRWRIRLSIENTKTFRNWKINEEKKIKKNSIWNNPQSRLKKMGQWIIHFCIRETIQILSGFAPECEKINVIEKSIHVVISSLRDFLAVRLIGKCETRANIVDRVYFSFVLSQMSHKKT